MCAEQPPAYLPPTTLADGPACPLPAANAAMRHLRVFLDSFNNTFNFFQAHEITVVFQRHFHGEQSSRSSWHAAVNMVCACALGTTEGARNIASEQLVQNALRLLPGILTEAPDTVSIGTLLLMVTYLISTSRTSTAAMILGSAAQMILLAGYQAAPPSPGRGSSQDLQKSRLFYHAYVLEQEVSLRLGKPPLLNGNMIACLPNERPGDCRGITCPAKGTTVNYLRERVFLARTQNRAWEALRSPSSSSKPSKEFQESTNQMLGELQQWGESLPVSIMPPELPEEPGACDIHQTQITDLHWSYLQTVVAIHSAIFSHPSLFVDPAIRNQAAVAVDECASAAREMLALFKCLSRERSSMQFSLSQLVWNMDGLFLHIMLNRRTPGAQEDAQLLESILDDPEIADIQHKGKLAFDAVTIMCKVVKEAMEQPRGSSGK